MSVAARKGHHSPEEYLALERIAPIKSEYYRGEIFAMAGASREHNLIAGNINAELRNQILKRPCESYASDMRVWIEATGLYTYPDVVVVCGQPRFQDSHVDTLLNPTVLVEILSPSTEAYDRGTKFRHYRKIPSLREFVLIAQDRMLVERYTRHNSDWVLSEFSLPEEILRLESIGCQVSLDAIYAKVTFEEEQAAEDQPRP